MVDYSKWKNIEISDDEDDTHPNIDTPSLFRWRHTARVERMAEAEKEKSEFMNEKMRVQQKLKELSSKKEQSDSADITAEELERLKIEAKKIDEKEQELKRKERLTPWNVDTIGKEGFTKTLINKTPKRVDTSELTDQQREEIYHKFIDENEEKVKHYGMLSKWDDCGKYLIENPQLVCEETANYLAMWCLNMAVEEKFDLMEFVAKQVIAMQYILELSKQLDTDPRSCVKPFFARIQKADQQYQDAFNDELNGFKERIRQRAQRKIEQAMKEIEEEERQKRLGPGGLDPAEVYESLPECLQKCFDSRDIELLKKTIAEMDREQAEYHMKRCTDSGMWLPEGGNTDKKDDDVYSSAD